MISTVFSIESENSKWLATGALDLGALQQASGIKQDGSPFSIQAGIKSVQQVIQDPGQPGLFTAAVQAYLLSQLGATRTVGSLVFDGEAVPVNFRTSNVPSRVADSFGRSRKAPPTKLYWSLTATSNVESYLRVLDSRNCAVHFIVDTCGIVQMADTSKVLPMMSKRENAEALFVSVVAPVTWYSSEDFGCWSLHTRGDNVYFGPSHLQRVAAGRLRDLLVKQYPQIESCMVDADSNRLPLLAGVADSVVDLPIYTD